MLDHLLNRLQGQLTKTRDTEHRVVSTLESVGEVLVLVWWVPFLFHALRFVSSPLPDLDLRIRVYIHLILLWL